MSAAAMLALSTALSTSDRLYATARNADRPIGSARRLRPVPGRRDRVSPTDAGIEALLAEMKKTAAERRALEDKHRELVQKAADNAAASADIPLMLTLAALAIVAIVLGLGLGMIDPAIRPWIILAATPLVILPIWAANKD